MSQYAFDPIKPVVETKYGQLRGIRYGDVDMFMGVKYADAKRFPSSLFGRPFTAIRKAMADIMPVAMNIDLHPRYPFSSPPMTGPAERPIYVAAVLFPSTLPRSLGGKALISRALFVANIIAPAMP